MLKILGNTKASELRFLNYLDLEDFLRQHRKGAERRHWGRSAHANFKCVFDDLPAEDREAIWSRYTAFEQDYPCFAHALLNLTACAEVDLRAKFGEFNMEALISCYAHDEHFRKCCDVWRSL